MLRLGSPALRLCDGATADGVNVSLVVLLAPVVTSRGGAECHFGHLAGSFAGDGRYQNIGRHRLTRRGFR